MFLQGFFRCNNQLKSVQNDTNLSSEALKFEWAWKFYSRKLSNSLFPLERRKRALATLMSLEKPTSKAIPYTEWETPINVVWQSGDTPEPPITNKN